MKLKIYEPRRFPFRKKKKPPMDMRQAQLLAEKKKKEDKEFEEWVNEGVKAKMEEQDKINIEDIPF